MTLLYVKRDIYFDEEVVNPVKVLASSGSVSETLQKITYLDLIEAENQSQIDKMATLSTNLSGKWGTLRIKKEELEKLDTRLAEELIRLEGEQAVGRLPVMAGLRQEFPRALLQELGRLVERDHPQERRARRQRDDPGDGHEEHRKSAP